MKNINTFFCRIFSCTIRHRAALVLFTLLFTIQSSLGQTTQPETQSDSIELSSAIHEAVANDNLYKIRRLLKAHPDLVNNIGADGNTPLDDIAFYDGKRMGMTLSSGTTGYGAITSSHYYYEPISSKSLQTAALLIAYGANLNSATNGKPPLFGAIDGHNWPLAKLLVEKGAKVNISVQGGDDNGMTPLHYVACSNNTEFAKILIAHKALINAKDSDGYTPLHLAALNGRLAMTLLLLTYKADVNAKNNDGDTPLFLAIKKRHKNVAALLRQRGGLKQVTDTNKDIINSKHQTTNILTVRLDGVYYSKESDGGGFNYLRFFSDSTVISISLINNPQDVWLYKTDKYNSKGTYKINGSNITFSSTSPGGTVDYNGQIKVDSLILETYSHINGYKGIEGYRFFKKIKSN